MPLRGFCIIGAPICMRGLGTLKPGLDTKLLAQLSNNGDGIADDDFYFLDHVFVYKKAAREIIEGWKQTESDPFYQDAEDLEAYYEEEYGGDAMISIMEACGDIYVVDASS